MPNAQTTGTAGYTGPESCDGLVQAFCNGFDDTCCSVCGAETRNMRDCTLQSTLAIVCADASCDGDSVSSGTTTTPVPAGSATTPEVGDGSDGQGSTQSTGTTLASGSITDDIIICQEETTELEQCASEKCPTCEDVLGESSLVIPGCVYSRGTRCRYSCVFLNHGLLKLSATNRRR